MGGKLERLARSLFAGAFFGCLIGLVIGVHTIFGFSFLGVIFSICFYQFEQAWE
jgi:hypothetical protein